MFGFLRGKGAGIGFTRAKKQVWEYDLSIWPCQGLKFMFASRDVVRACEQLEQSDFETDDHFSVVIKGDFNVEICRSSFNLGKTMPSFGAWLETSVFTPSLQV